MWHSCRNRDYHQYYLSLSVCDWSTAVASACLASSNSKASLHEASKNDPISILFSWSSFSIAAIASCSCLSSSARCSEMARSCSSSLFSRKFLLNYISCIRLSMSWRRRSNCAALGEPPSVFASIDAHCIIFWIPFAFVTSRWTAVRWSTFVEKKIWRSLWVVVYCMIEEFVAALSQKPCPFGQLNRLGAVLFIILQQWL